MSAARHETADGKRKSGWKNLSNNKQHGEEYKSNCTQHIPMHKRGAISLYSPLTESTHQQGT